MRKISAFAYLNTTQFLASLNDNLYKYLLLYYVIDLEGVSQAAIVLSLLGAIFVVPFLLFSMSAGNFADRYSKRNIIVIMKVLELVTVGLLLLSFILHNPTIGYIGFFLLATEEAVLSPCKYGIVPELVPKDHITKANGYLTSLAYCGVMGGVFFASLLTQFTTHDYVQASIVLFIIGALGLFTALNIPVTPKAGSKRKFTLFFLGEVVKTLREAHRIDFILPSILGGAFFLFVASFSQANIVPYSIYCLGLTDVQAGYLVFVTTVGVCIGAVTAGRISGPRVALGLIPIALFGMSICFFLFMLTVGHLYATIVLTLTIGVFGGMYLVPLDAYIQAASPNEWRGQNVASSNFLGWCGVLVASGLFYYLRHVLQIEPSHGFAIMGALSFIVGLFYLLCFAFPTLRLFAYCLSQLGYFTLKGTALIPAKGGCLLITNQKEAALFLLSYRERIINLALEESLKIHFVYDLMRLLPPERIKEVLMDGKVVCFLLPRSPNELIQFSEKNGIPVLEVFLKHSVVEVRAKGTI